LENKLLLIQKLSKLTREKKYEEITEYCDQNLKSDPNNLVLLKAKAHTTYEIGHIPAFSVVLECTKKILGQSPEDIESLILQIRTLRRLDRNDEAKIFLELAESIEADNPEVLIQRSSILLGENRNNEAKKVLNHLEKIDMEKAFINLGALAWNENRYDDALHFFSRHLEIEPDNFVAAKNKVGLLCQMERYDDSVSVAEKFIEKYGERQFRMYRELGILHYEISQIYASRSGEEYNNQPCVFGSRILDESDEKWNDENFINTRKTSEHLRKALEVFEKIDEKGIHNARTRYWKARTCISLEDAELGTNAIQDCLDEKKNWDIESYQASFLKRQGKNEEAIELCDKILKDYPNDPIAKSTKVDALYWSGNIEEYERLFHKYYPKEEPKKPTSELSLRTSKTGPFTNPIKVMDFLADKNNIKNNLWILDPYFDSKGFSLLNSAVEQNSEINEIHIITDMKKLVSFWSMHPIDKVKEFRSYINRFNTAFRGKTTIQMIISSEFTEKNESDYHDRFLISQERVWNFASAYQIYGNQIVDIQKLEDQETIDNDLKMFNKLWNGEKIHKIYGKMKSDNDEFKKLLNFVAEELEKRREPERENFNKRVEDLNATPSKLEEILDSEKNNLQD